MGYDPRSGQWVGTWVDSGSPQLYVMQGSFDESGKVLTMTCEAPHPVTQKTTTYRSVETWTGEDERVFDMYVTGPDGSDEHMFHYVYTRARS